MRPHYRLGYLLVAFSFAHASLLMGPAMGRVNSGGWNAAMFAPVVHSVASRHHDAEREPECAAANKAMAFLHHADGRHFTDCPFMRNAR